MSQHQDTTQHIIEQLLTALQPYAQRIMTGQPQGKAQRRQLLRATLNTLPPFTLSKEEIALLNVLLQQELTEKRVVTVDDIPTLVRFDKTKIKIWQGDITTLAADAIVNAANKELQGCFQPLHNCIDNAIHSAAGVTLRDDCATIIQTQGNFEETGQAKITSSYNLPCQYVLHTVGPIVQGAVTDEHQQLLQSCYENCLALANQTEGVSSIAFCCISTGVFGYPQRDAAKVAITAVHQWLINNPDSSIDTVIFNTFKGEDTHFYQQLLS
jgi:O-acetyl-ADP-ribose deacetylase (regulator of RNase III)